MEIKNKFNKGLYENQEFLSFQKLYFFENTFLSEVELKNLIKAPD